MKAFFTKHPADLDELTAIKMILKKIELAKLKCEEGDVSYNSDLAKSYEMLEDYFNEIEINPATLI